MFCNENLFFARDHVDYTAVTSRLSCCHGSEQFVCDKLSATFPLRSVDWWKTEKAS